MPNIRVTLLNNRRDNIIVDPAVHSHRTNQPTAEQVAIIWVNDEGEPPFFKGIVLEGKEGGIKSMHYYNPNVDPLCYPMLFPKGTQGYHYNIPYKITVFFIFYHSYLFISYRKQLIMNSRKWPIILMGIMSIQVL